ncbi:radical SAM protein [bacterium]|nr:radical SAM protein [bacterium]
MTKIIPHQRAIGRLLRIMWHYRFSRRTEVPYAPYRLWIEPTNRCNLECVMCPNREQAEGELGFMEQGLFRRVIDQAAGSVHDVNLHHRGEPTLHPELEEMIRYADGKGVKVKLHTNGTALTEQRSEALLRSGLRLISFSFDGYDAETYESVRVGARFEATLEKILRFLELKRRFGPRGPRTVVEVMEIAGRAPDPAARARFADSLAAAGLDRLIIKKPHNWAGNVDVGKSVPDAFSACTFPWHALVVLWDGRVGACPHDFFAKIIHGDVRDTPLREIFNSPRIRDLRASMREGRFEALSEPCRSCDTVRRKRAGGIPLSSLKFLRD